MITNSLEWPPQEAILLRKSTGLVHEQEVRKMIKNIQLEVTELSRAEVLVRQGRKHEAELLLAKVNKDIEMVEEFLLVAALLG